MTTPTAVQFWLSEAGRHPLLAASEEIELGRLVRGWLDHPDPCPRTIRRGLRARDRMVAGNLLLVGSIVRREIRRYPRLVSASDHADMLQAGAIGLMRGVERFDPERGYKLSTFAFHWIWQATTRWVATDCRTIRLPVTHSEQIAKIYKAIDCLRDRHGRPPTQQEIAEECGITAEMIDTRLRTGQLCLSLDYMVKNSDDEVDFGSFQAAPEEEHQYDDLYSLLECLTPMQQTLIRESYGIESGRPVTRRALADAHGLSCDRVQRELRTAHCRLRGVEQLSLGRLE